MLQNTRSWQDAANNFPKVRMLDFYSRLPRVFGVHIGWIIALGHACSLLFLYTENKAWI